jgi:hypothetical protein
MCWTPSMTFELPSFQNYTKETDRVILVKKRKASQDNTNQPITQPFESSATARQDNGRSSRPIKRLPNLPQTQGQGKQQSKPI